MTGGRTIVITGASRGLGRALAETFAGQGVRLGLVARSAADLDAVAEQLTGKGAEVASAACDVTDPDGVRVAFARIAERHGGIDSVIVNAGISPMAKRAHNLPLGVWQDVLRVNLTGSFVTALAAYPHLARSGRGRLVFTTSVMAAVPRPGLSAYTASKAGIEGLTRALAVDWAADGILVNAVAPGFIDAGLGTAFAESPRLRAQVTQRALLGRFGGAAELAEAYVFLAGDACGYVTGQVLRVDGGYGRA